MPEEVAVARTAELREGRGRLVHAGGRPLALFLVQGQPYAIDNTCLHRGGPLCEGDVEGAVVTCPLHGWQYDVRTGQCATNPAVAVRAYPVRVEGGEVRVQV